MIKKTFWALLVGISANSFTNLYSDPSVELSDLANRLESLQKSAQKLQECVKEKRVSDMKFIVKLSMLSSSLKQAKASFDYAKSLKAIQIALHKEAGENRTLADFLPISITHNLSPEKQKAITEAVEAYNKTEKNSKKQKLYETHGLTEDLLVVKGVKVAQELSSSGNLEDALFLCKLIADHYQIRANSNENEARTTTQNDLTTEETNLGKMLPVLETNCQQLEKDLSAIA